MHSQTYAHTYPQSFSHSLSLSPIFHAYIRPFALFFIRSLIHSLSLPCIPSANKHKSWNTTIIHSHTCAQTYYHSRLFHSHTQTLSRSHIFNACKRQAVIIRTNSLSLPCFSFSHKLSLAPNIFHAFNIYAYSFHSLTLSLFHVYTYISESKRSTHCYGSEIYAHMHTFIHTFSQSRHALSHSLVCLFSKTKLSALICRSQFMHSYIHALSQLVKIKMMRMRKSVRIGESTALCDMYLNGYRAVEDCCVRL